MSDGTFLTVSAHISIQGASFALNKALSITIYAPAVRAEYVTNFAFSAFSGAPSALLTSCILAFNANGSFKGLSLSTFSDVVGSETDYQKYQEQAH